MAGVWSLPAPARAARAVSKASRGCATRPAIRSTWTQELIDAHADLPTLAPFVHLPVQSGSNRILKAMNRRHDARLLSRHRRAAARGAAGYCALVRFHRRLSRRDRRGFRGDAGRSSARSASPRPSPSNIRRGPARPAPSARIRSPKSVKSERLAVLQALVEEQRHAFNAATVGRTVEVLFEKPGRHEGQIAGKSPYMQPVHAMGGLELIGSILPVTIVAAGSNSLAGRIVGRTTATRGSRPVTLDRERRPSNSRTRRVPASRRPRSRSPSRTIATRRWSSASTTSISPRSSAARHRLLRQWQSCHAEGRVRGLRAGPPRARDPLWPRAARPERRARRRRWRHSGMRPPGQPVSRRRTPAAPSSSRSRRAAAARCAPAISPRTSICAR